MGFQPLTPLEVAQQKDQGLCPAAYRFARDKTELIEGAIESLAKAARRIKKYADIHCRSLEFQVGDKVLLKLTPQIWKRVTDRRYHKGLIQRYDGPFVVKERIGNVAYRLALPDRLKIHPTFHVSFLKPYYEEAGSSRAQQRRAPLGESEPEATWERGATLWQFEDLVQAYKDNLTTRTSSDLGSGVWLGEGKTRQQGSKVKACYGKRWCALVLGNVGALQGFAKDVGCIRRYSECLAKAGALLRGFNWLARRDQ
ncbi:hypothetical protein LWI29_021866 [Acer saccharum]|uniref:Tf2-1-like SH3-like domain-containing protein n=1 Tax=Acer saccharum TaxID=4024 RepID=A0AA39SWE8_ACESA|nr:hypothetical protein LWI29_021866 [Acer saccharum]